MKQIFPTLGLLVFAFAFPTVGHSQAMGASKMDPPQQGGRHVSPLGNPEVAKSNTFVTVRLESVDHLQVDTAKVAVARRAEAPSVVFLQIIPGTSVEDIAYALRFLASSPMSTVKLRADELKAFLSPARSSFVSARDNIYLLLATRLKDQFDKRGSGSIEVPLRIVSSNR